VAWVRVPLCFIDFLLLFSFRLENLKELELEFGKYGETIASEKRTSATESPTLGSYKEKQRGKQFYILFSAGKENRKIRGKAEEAPTRGKEMHHVNTNFFIIVNCSIYLLATFIQCQPSYLLLAVVIPDSLLTLLLHLRFRLPGIARALALVVAQRHPVPVIKLIVLFEIRGIACAVVVRVAIELVV